MKMPPKGGFLLPIITDVSKTLVKKIVLDRINTWIRVNTYLK